MKQNLILAVLTLVLAYQLVDPDDGERLRLLDEEKERLENEIDKLDDTDAGGNQRTNTRELLSVVAMNAYSQDPATADEGEEPQYDNPLGLSGGERQHRIRRREALAGVLLGKPAPAVAAPVEQVPPAGKPVPVLSQGVGPMMRAKLRVESVSGGESGSQSVIMRAVGDDKYGEDGQSENNTFARFTPTADLSMAIQNPNLVGKIVQGREFYVDFSEVPAKPSPAALSVPPLKENSGDEPPKQ